MILLICRIIKGNFEKMMRNFEMILENDLVLCFADIF